MSFKKRDVQTYESLGKMRLPPGVTTESVLQFYEALDCSKSLAAAILFRNEEWEQLFDLSCNPMWYNSAASFRDAYLASSFLSKSQFIKTGWDKEERAIEKFKTFETRCRKTNEFFKSGIQHMDQTSVDATLLFAMRRKLLSILGEFQPSELFDLASWGPGVSTLIKGEETFSAKKFQFETGITRDCYPLARLIPLAYPGWGAIIAANGFPNFQVGNKVITVPKTSKIDRVIAVEPGLNLWFQLGLGRMIRRRLGRVGIDLTDQTRNQQLARMASKTGHLATVDFSSASDSIAEGLVKFLFGVDSPLLDGDSLDGQTWFGAMDVMRSRYGTVGTQVTRWEKFSSMGNGFTFDLESLIFFSAAHVVCKKLGLPTSEVSVFGDDVIIPVEAYDLFSSFSNFLGFTVNPVKSFASGCFRESCGSHYFAGVNCKPVYLQDELTSPQSLYNFANIVRLRSHWPDFGCDSRFRPIFYWLQTRLPKKIRFKVSAISNHISGTVDPLEGGFVSNFDEASPSRQTHGVEGYYVPRLAWVAIKREVDYDGLLFAKLQSMENGSGDILSALKLPTVVKGDGNTIPLRGRTKCVFKKRTFVRRWYNLGPWI